MYLCQNFIKYNDTIIVPGTYAMAAQFEGALDMKACNKTMTRGVKAKNIKKRSFEVKVLNL